MSSEQTGNSPISQNDPLDDIAAFSIGAADREESLAVKRLLAETPALQREAAEYAAAASLLNAVVPKYAAPPELKGRIMAAAHASPKIVPFALAVTPVATSVRTSRAIFVWLAAAAALVLFALNVFWLVQVSRMRESQELAVVASASFDMAVALLTDSESKRIELMDEAGEMRAMVVWMPDHDEALMVTHSLPALSDDTTYQLWIIGEKGPMSAGVFDTDADGVYSMMFSSPMDWEAVGSVGISVEPSGGSPLPTTTPLAFGTM